jgi:hypothetical protein
MPDDMITIEVTADEHRMLLEALDKKIWSLEQVGLAGAYRVKPAYERLRADLANVIKEQIP